MSCLYELVGRRGKQGHIQLERAHSYIHIARAFFQYAACFREGNYNCLNLRGKKGTSDVCLSQRPHEPAVMCVLSCS